MQSRIHFVALLAMPLVLVSGCASIDFDYPRTASYALDDTSDTELARKLEPIVADKPKDQSGFFMLMNGIDALAVRLGMAQQAQKSIDAQYYLIKNHAVGRTFLYALLRAADRGVRVRLLIDDMYTSRYDVGLAAIDSHPTTLSLARPISTWSSA